MLIKKSLDILFLFFFFPFLIPLFLFISLILLLFQGRPLFFIQRRSGYKSHTFKLYKFRTMHNNTNLKDEERVTKLGRFLRRTKLDELPQFFNIIKGDLSIVGPRPLLPEYLNFYTSEQLIRFDVMPGITGWSQINYTNYSDWNKRLYHDIWYVKNRSILLDIKIVILTIKLLINLIIKNDKKYNSNFERLDKK